MARVSGKRKRFLKIIAWGAPGTGKTRFALDGGTYKVSKTGKVTGDGELWPDLLVVNAEGGVPAYEFLFEGQFVVEDCNTLSGLVALLKQLKAGNFKLEDGTLYQPQTLVIDTWTKFVEIYTNAMEQKKDYNLTLKDRARINQEFNAATNLLLELNLHIILVVHEKPKWKKIPNSTQIEQDGLQLDAGAKLERWPDFVLYFHKRAGQQPTRVEVQKGRGANLGEDDNGIISNASWKANFKAIAERWSAGENRHDVTDGDAIRQTGQEIDQGVTFVEQQGPKKKVFANATFAKEWAASWDEMYPDLHLTPDLLKHILGDLQYLADWGLSLDEANQRVSQYVSISNEVPVTQ